MTDEPKLKGQLKVIRDEMAALDDAGVWVTVPELQPRIQVRLGGLISQTGLSAGMRSLRKPEHGSYRLDKRRRGKTDSNLWEFRLRIKTPGLFE